MIHVEDGDGSGVLVDLVDHAIRTDPGGVQTLELAAQRSTHSVRVLQQRTEDELQDGGCDLLRKPLHAPLRGAGKAEGPALLGHADG